MSEFFISSLGWAMSKGVCPGCKKYAPVLYKIPARYDDFRGREFGILWREFSEVCQYCISNLATRRNLYQRRVYLEKQGHIYSFGRKIPKGFRSTHAFAVESGWVYVAKVSSAKSKGYQQKELRGAYKIGKTIGKISYRLNSQRIPLSGFVCALYSNNCGLLESSVHSMFAEKIVGGIRPKEIFYLSPQDISYLKNIKSIDDHPVFVFCNLESVKRFEKSGRMLRREYGIEKGESPLFIDLIVDGNIEDTVTIRPHTKSKVRRELKCS